MDGFVERAVLLQRALYCGRFRRVGGFIAEGGFVHAGGGFETAVRHGGQLSENSSAELAVL